MSFYIVVSLLWYCTAIKPNQCDSNDQCRPSAEFYMGKDAALTRAEILNATWNLAAVYSVTWTSAFSAPIVRSMDISKKMVAQYDVEYSTVEVK